MACSNFILHINCVILFYVLFEKVRLIVFKIFVFFQVHDGYLPVEALLTLSFASLTILYVIYAALLTKTSINYVDHFYTVITLVFYGFGLTPIIR